MRAVVNGSGLVVGVAIVDLATAIDDVGLGLVQEIGNGLRCCMLIANFVMFVNPPPTLNPPTQLQKVNFLAPYP